MTENYVFLSSEDKTFFLTISVVQVVLGFILNGCVIYLFQRNCHLLDIPSNLILLNMSIMDFISCFLLLPYETYVILNGENGMLKNVPNIFLFFTLNASMHGAVFMSVDRLLTVIYPLRYYAIVTATRIRRILALNWFVSFVFSILLFETCALNNKGCGYFIAVKDIFCCLIICISYSVICYIASKQVRKMTPKDEQMTAWQYSRLVCKRSLKSAKKSGAVVFFFLISFVPFSLLHLYFNFSVERENNEALFWSFTLLFWQSSLNPLLFCSFSDKLRTIARQTFSCQRRL